MDISNAKVAVIGGAGQLGSDLLPHFPRGISLQHADIEITNADSVQAVLDQLRPDYVINTAAYNLVDRAEVEPDIAFGVNAVGVKHLAEWCTLRDVPLLHVSTDHVFGLAPSGIPLDEAALPSPASAYAITKLAGEHFAQTCPQHVIVRTCGLYGRNATRSKGNFVQTMLRLGAERDELKVVADQFCTPTVTVDVAAGIANLLQHDAHGLYHVTNTGGCSWFEFATEIFRQAGITVNVVPISSQEFGAAARRPAWSILDCGRYHKLTGTELPHWKSALATFLGEPNTAD